jgi:hypothetical protein
MQRWAAALSAALAAAFASVTVIDAEPYVRTKHRQRARFTMGPAIDWFVSQTGKGEPLDELLAHNVEVARHYLRVCS